MSNNALLVFSVINSLLPIIPLILLLIFYKKSRKYSIPTLICSILFIVFLFFRTTPIFNVLLIILNITFIVFLTLTLFNIYNTTNSKIKIGFIIILGLLLIQIVGYTLVIDIIKDQFYYSIYVFYENISYNLLFIVIGIISVLINIGLYISLVIISIIAFIKDIKNKN